MSVASDVLMWAQRVLGKGEAAPHELLEIREHAGGAAASDAFHKIARFAHPDLHRNILTPAEFEQVTLAYAKVANAYQEMRTRKPSATPQGTPTVADEGSVVSQRMAAQAMGSKPVAKRPEPLPPPSAAMNSKALVYYRKAELVLRRGDHRGALLQIKMAIAADPQSAVLRAALAEIEAELTKKP